ncbi:phosphoenolpyruvate carboxykinase [Longilinea arvoryzae]|uniref:Phosphoenolpyruvate carboxykinase (ATP) n=1 Tax=Longilinea arvoryzae TaxID=360412 RepID=A0A0S7BAK7_9CHLR|nr:phosphoenolpyruvate carboxykinase (ATP) [Longilinea arvoryzae]GAP14687.1 phosphoenolpyruvate carboxykinase [Longilinea arvoryzae]
MQNLGIPSEFGLDLHQLINIRTAHWNFNTPELVEQVILRQEGELSPDGAVMVNTGQYTGRSPNDKFIVKNANDDDKDIWWGKVNRPIAPEKFEQIYRKVTAYLQNRDVFVQDLQVGAHPVHHLSVRVITEKAWHNLFARDLLIRLPPEKLTDFRPEYTIIQVPDFVCVPADDGTNSGAFILADFTRKVVLIGGTGYAGEIKKSIFTVMNYLMPHRGVLSMHCSANVGDRGDVALFFGLSGTGKTTLSSDPDRRLIGDDEHGWADDGVFNFEGGCYAKTIRLQPDLEPLIWQATHRFGAVLENVAFNPIDRSIDFDSDRRTENTRGAYPIDFILNNVPEGYAGHPKNIFFLTADAFGVLPPIAKLTPDQAMYYFLSGYTSKLAGTEKGLGKEPQATFSTCFGAPFLPLEPNVYARLLGQKIQRHDVQVWLINTGWSGGAFGTGNRIRLPYTRSMVRGALTGQLDSVPFQTEEFFGLSIPRTCPGVPPEMLNPIHTWNDQDGYRKQANTLIEHFNKNFEQFKAEVSYNVLAVGPVVAK